MTPSMPGFRTSPLAHHAALQDPARLAYLRASGLLDGAASAALDRLTRIAGIMVDVPVALVSLVDDLTQHFPGLTGLGGWAGARRNTPLSHSFCQHVVATSSPLKVSDARQDALVAYNLAVSELGVAAYAAVPLRTRDGLTLGAFCAIDGVPRAWTDEQMQVLEELAVLAVVEIEQHMQRSTADHTRTHTHEMDAITGLVAPERFATLAHALLEAAHHGAEPLSVVSLDLLHFGEANERHGPDVCDRMLRETACCILRDEVPGLVAGRMHGDEFTVLLPAHDYEAAFRWARRLSERLALASVPHGPTSLTGSVGVATWNPGDLPVLLPVLHRADAACRTDRLRKLRALGAEPVGS